MVLATWLLWVLVLVGIINCVFAYWYMLRESRKNVVVVETIFARKRKGACSAATNPNAIELEHLLFEPQEAGPLDEIPSW